LSLSQSLSYWDGLNKEIIAELLLVTGIELLLNVVIKTVAKALNADK
jgi:hypothetical protein